MWTPRILPVRIAFAASNPNRTLNELPTLSHDFGYGMNFASPIYGPPTVDYRPWTVDLSPQSIHLPDPQIPEPHLVPVVLKHDFSFFVLGEIIGDFLELASGDGLGPGIGFRSISVDHRALISCLS